MNRYAADRAYLKGLICGSVNLLAEETFAKLEPMFARYEADPEMYALLERASELYGDAALDAAAWVLARFSIEESQRRANDLLIRSYYARAASWAATNIVIKAAQRRAKNI